MKERHILITSIIRDGEKDEVKYFYYSFENERKFGCRVARSEAAVYTELSQNKALDEIIAVGYDTSVNEMDVLEKQVIRNMEDISSDTQKMSDYAFFKYRLCEYMNGLDFEVLDIYERVPKSRQAEIEEAIRFVLGEDLSRGFKQIHEEYGLLSKIYEKAGITTKDEKDLVKNILFVHMRKEDKIVPREENDGIEISFLPIIKTDEKYGTFTNSEKLVELLNIKEDKELYLYVDLQGFSLADGYTIFNMLNLLDIESKYNVTIKAVSSLAEKKDAIAERLCNVSSRYKTSQLISGIEAFVNYGQTEIINDYWRKTGIRNDYIAEFLYAMSMVDTGICLCNNEEIIAGIKKLVSCVKDEERAHQVDLSSEETVFIMLIRKAVAADYAFLVDDNGELDLGNLIKWEYRKGFYQQAMTIIESKLPEILSSHGALYYARNEEDKQKMLVFLNDKYWRENVRFRWTFNDVNHWMVKTMPRQPAIAKHQRQTPLENLMAGILINSLHEGSESGVQLFTVADDIEALKALLVAYYKMGTLRNAVCHAEKKEEGNDENEDYTQVNPVWKEVSDSIRSFIGKMDKVLEDVKGKEFTSVLISDEERTDYINNHKFYPDDNSENGKQRRNRNGRSRRNRNGNSSPEGNNKCNDQPCSVDVGKDGSLHITLNLTINGTGWARN